MSTASIRLTDLFILIHRSHQWETVTYSFSSSLSFSVFVLFRTALDHDGQNSLWWEQQHSRIAIVSWSSGLGEWDLRILVVECDKHIAVFVSKVIRYQEQFFFLNVVGWKSPLDWSIKYVRDKDVMKQTPVKPCKQKGTVVCSDILIANTFDSFGELLH
jgi:hypothetical protein